MRPYRSVLPGPIVNYAATRDGSHDGPGLDTGPAVRVSLPATQAEIDGDGSRDNHNILNWTLVQRRTISIHEKV